MIELLFLVGAAAILLTAVVLVASPLLGNPERRRRRTLVRAYREGILSAAEYQRQIAITPAAGPRRPLLAIALSITLPLAGIALYNVIGTPEALTRSAFDTAHQTAVGGMLPGGIESAVEALRQRLTAKPDDAAGWTLLSRSLKTLGRYDEALNAIENARRILPDDPNLQVETAEAMLFAGDRPELPPAARELLAQALLVDPENQKGLWLAGLDAAQRAEYAAALAYWQRLRTQLADAGEVAAALDAQIAEVRAAQNGNNPAAAAVAAQQREGAQEKDAASAALHIRVTLDPTLAAAAPQGGALFVFARPPEGGPPYAGKRLAPGPFPLEITLDDGDAMLPGRNLSSAPAVQVGARWSAAGAVEAQNGDLEGLSEVLHLPAAGKTVELTINRRY